MGLFSCLSPLIPRSRSSAADSLLSEKHARGLSSSDSNDHAVREQHRHDIDSERKLTAMRDEIKKADLDVYCVPTADAHGSEYVGECDKRRAWLSGFDGSAGVAIVTRDQALMFTDSRYYIQASKQLSKAWTLQRVGEKGVKSWDQWLLTLPQGSRIGFDPTQAEYTTTKALLAKLSANKLEARFLADNLVDRIWHDRPIRSSESIRIHPLKFAGRSAQNKLAELRTHLDDSPAGSGYILSSLNNIAWILNLRGGDIAFSPFFYAYLLVNKREEDGFTLWVQRTAVDSELSSYVEQLGGKIKAYERVFADLSTLGDSGHQFLTDGSISWAIVEAVGKERLIVNEGESPVTAAEAIKNDVELEGFKRAYLRDGAAWVRWAAWLEEEIQTSKSINEWDAGVKLTEYRRNGENFAGLAYENISATGEHAALPHYAPSAGDSAIISKTLPYLNDSGAHYLDGTIDTTRTVHFGKPTKEHKRAFTRVLQGHIAIDSLVFPEGTTGGQVDALARRPLWSEGMNYLHGTGHGVGEYLSVHEGPQGLSGKSNVIFQPGHILSNEPAYYEAGSYGIRTESVIFVKEVKTRRGFGDAKWLGFERLTMVPIQRAMVDQELLSSSEKQWLTEHNNLCKKVLLPLVEHDKRARKYLMKQ